MVSGDTRIFQIIGELHEQAAADLLRRVLALQILLDLLAQHQVGNQFGRLGSAGPLLGQHVRGPGPIPAARAVVAGQFPRDR